MLERSGVARVVAPDDIEGLGTLTRDRNKIVALYAKGYADGAAIARRDVDYLDARADDVFARTVTIAYDDGGAPHAYIDARALAAEDAALRFRVVARTLSICAPGSGKRHVDAVEALVSHWRGQQAVRLPRKRTANRKKHVIEVCEDVTHANRRYRERDRS